MKHLFLIAAIIACLPSAILTAEQTIAPPQETVRVRFQTQNPRTRQWTGGSTSTKGAVTESMMANQISARYGGQPVRILAAHIKGPNIRVQVRYSIIRGNSHGTASATLTNAITPSMAQHQLEARHPNATIQVFNYIQQ